MQKKTKSLFPNPRTTPTDSGIIAVGGKLGVTALVEAYEKGIFPWPHEGYPMLWFCPDERGVIDFSELHLSRSFLKWMKKNESEILIKENTQFNNVVLNCAIQKRAGQQGTWINQEIIESFEKLHLKGYAFSLECFRNENLIGGIYGVKTKKYTSCESMFYKETNASKFALYSLIKLLQARGETWLDIQMVTDASKQFGGKYISKTKFLDRIL